MQIIFFAASIALAISAAQPNTPHDAEVQAIAERYLKAISGNGASDDRGLLLGGVTPDAAKVKIDNWRIVGKEPVLKEQADLSEVVSLMSKLDAAGRSVLANSLLVNPPDLEKVDYSQARAIIPKTQQVAKQFLETYPAFAYIARVDRPVYWHPRNPVRKLLVRAGKKGAYELELHIFTIETVDTRSGLRTLWPLRVFRFTTDKVDTKWAVLAASEWEPE